MSRTRGFSLIELLVGLLILTIVIMTTIGMFTERKRRLREANDTILSYQALKNEAEIWRRINFNQLDSQPKTFQSDTAILAPMWPFTTAIKVDSPRADVKQVTLTITWATGKRKANLSLARVDTGGSNLW
jgi:prepilin-type N-terminal cleavage/methylation domain-containing protein